MSKLLYKIIILLIPVVASSQIEPRQILWGQAVSDSVQAENITVQNKTSGNSTITDGAGNFHIDARLSDTLLFTGLPFRGAQLVLKKEHFAAQKLIVKLDVDVTVLDEITVHNLTGNLAVDARRAKTADPGIEFNAKEINRNIEDNIYEYKYSEKVNNALPQTESPLTGVDFRRIYRKIFPKKKKK